MITKYVNVNVNCLSLEEQRVRIELLITLIAAWPHILISTSQLANMHMGLAGWSCYVYLDAIVRKLSGR